MKLIKPGAFAAFVSVVALGTAGIAESAGGGRRRSLQALHEPEQE
jgi:hypothetical protein